MMAAEISLLAMTIGAVLLTVWVFSPSRRNRLESYGAMPLDDDHGERGHDGERA